MLDGNPIWIYYRYCFGGTDPFEKKLYTVFSVNGDTVVNGKQYLKLYRDSYMYKGITGNEFYGDDDHYDDGLYALLREEDVRITFYTPSSNRVDSYIGNYMEYTTTADSVIICLDKHNYIPYIQTYQKDLFIQNETIGDQRSYLGRNILVGNHVTNDQPTGNVLIQSANIKMEGESVALMPGTTIINSNVEINTGQ